MWGPEIMYADITELIENIDAPMRLEGLKLSAEAIEDMHKVDRGEMTTEEAVQRSIRRFTVEKVQRSE